MSAIGKTLKGWTVLNETRWFGRRFYNVINKDTGITKPTRADEFDELIGLKQNELWARLTRELAELERS